MKESSIPATGLPIDEHLAAIGQAVATGAVVLIKAEPGAGKTTRVPPMLLDKVAGQILVLEPRRLAARLSAERVAAELGEAVGATVGYRIRFDARVTAATRIVFVTEGVFLRLLLDKPTLPGVAAVVIDEFHERHIHTDLALAALCKLQGSQRPDLNLVIMSATLDTSTLEAYLPAARVFDVPGRTFPVEIEYLPLSDDVAPWDGVATGLGRLLDDPRSPGNTLVFLTGLAEIRRTAERIAPLAGRYGVEVLPLSAELPLKEQTRIFERDGRRKIVLATNVAETSLTLPNVTGVLDLGRAKIAGHATWSGMPTLDVKKVSQASAIQRAGRAGRTMPGVAYRLYSEADYRARPAFTLPDIRRLDLAETCLDVLALARAFGEDEAGAPETLLPWFEAPQARALQSARDLLVNLGALDGDGHLTPFGLELARVPLHPRLSALVVKGREQGIARHALAAACLISERMILGRKAGAAMREDCDVLYQMDLLARFAKGMPLGGRAVEAAWDPGRARQVLSVYQGLAGRLGIGVFPSPSEPLDRHAFSVCLLTGFPDRVARRRPGAKAAEGRERVLYNFCLGRGGMLAESSVVKDAELILALDAAESQAVSADRGTMIYVASAITPEALLESPASALSECTETAWTDAAQRVDVWERTTYGQIVVAEKRALVTAETQAGVEDLLREKLAEHWPKPFIDAADLMTYHERARLLLEREPALALPYFTGEMLELLQAAICENKRSFREIATRNLLHYIEDQLPYDLQQRLAREVPLEQRLANGRTLKVFYEAGRPPYVSGFIQDFYGIRVTPALLGGQVPLTVHLAAPNRRPVQVTSDLAGFWERGYPPLRAELGRKYPKHYWPENPIAAAPHLFKARADGRGKS